MPNMASLSLWRTPNLYQTMKTTTLPITRTKHFLYRQIRCHFQSRNSSGFRRQTQYTRFTRAQSIKYQWQESPGFRYGVGALSIAGVGFVVVNTEIVPVSGRRRFNWVSPAKEEQLGSEQFQQVLQEFGGQILPAWHPNARNGSTSIRQADSSEWPGGSGVGGLRDRRSDANQCLCYTWVGSPSGTEGNDAATS